MLAAVANEAMLHFISVANRAIHQLRREKEHIRKLSEVRNACLGLLQGPEPAIARMQRHSSSTHVCTLPSPTSLFGSSSVAAEHHPIVSLALTRTSLPIRLAMSNDGFVSDTNDRIRLILSGTWGLPNASVGVAS